MNDKNEIEKLKRAIGNYPIAPNPYYYTAAKESMQEEQTRLREEIEKLNREIEMEKLAAEIDKTPIININEIDRITKSKEDKLPRKLRAGWKL